MNSIRGDIQSLSLGLLLLSGCVSGAIPRWSGEIWPGKPEIGGVVRTETDGTQRQMLATEEKFRKGAWVSYEDLRKFYVIIQSCKQWKKNTPMMSPQETARVIQPILENTRESQ